MRLHRLSASLLPCSSGDARLLIESVLVLWEPRIIPLWTMAVIRPVEYRCHAEKWATTSFSFQPSGRSASGGIPASFRHQRSCAVRSRSMISLFICADTSTLSRYRGRRNQREIAETTASSPISPQCPGANQTKGTKAGERVRAGEGHVQRRSASLDATSSARTPGRG